MKKNQKNNMKLSTILGVSLTIWSWTKATLPTNYGGLDLHSAHLHVHAASTYIASRSSSMDLISEICLLTCISLSSPFLDNAMSLLSSTTARPDWTNLKNTDVPLHQCHLLHAINETVNSAPSLRFQALAHSSSLPRSGGWLNVIPSPALKLRLQDLDIAFITG